MADTPETTNESLLARVEALLKTGEQYIIDNVEAGVTMLEGMFSKKDEAPAADAASDEAKS